jgi:hypothetical protein
MDFRLQKYINDFVGKKQPLNSESFFEFKKSNIHGNGTFLVKDCPINTSYERTHPGGQTFYFNDIHFTRVLKILGINCEITDDKGDKTYLEQFVKLDSIMYDKFVDYYLDQNSSKEDSDVIILTDVNKFFLLKQKQIGEELFQIYGIESWLVQAFKVCVKLFTIDELKIHPLVLKINELITYPNFDQRFKAILSQSTTITTLTKEKYDLVLNTNNIIFQEKSDINHLELIIDKKVNYFETVKNFIYSDNLPSLQTSLIITVPILLTMIYFKMDNFKKIF